LKGRTLSKYVRFLIIVVSGLLGNILVLVFTCFICNCQEVPALLIKELSLSCKEIRHYIYLFKELGLMKSVLRRVNGRNVLIMVLVKVRKSL